MLARVLQGYTFAKLLPMRAEGQGKLGALGETLAHIVLRCYSIESWHLLI